VLDRVSIILALIASLALLRQRQIAIAAFSLALVAASGLSGDHQSTIRYMATVPALPIWLAGIGRRPWFDRIWSLGCTLLLALLLMLFSRDFWVA
jgi:ABC-type Fe3+-siderophore transport system permease subunit